MLFYPYSPKHQHSVESSAVIGAQTIEEIRNLLKQGTFSQRAIAKRIGVSRGTVAKVAANRKRTVSEQERIAVSGESRDSASKPSLPMLLPPLGIILPKGKPRRCFHCGVRVRMPCLACQLHRLRQYETLDSTDSNRDNSENTRHFTDRLNNHTSLPCF